MRKRRNAFTLVELLAVIVILAIILVIAVPKIMSVIEDTKKGTLESTAKMIASAAEKAKVQNAVLGKDIEITCDSVVKLNNVDYERCNIEFIDNKVHVDIKGSRKFENMYVCKGTKDEAHIVNRCPNEKVMVELQPNTEEQFNNISGIYKEGDVIYLDTPTKQDFTFIRWEVVSGDSVLEDGNKLTVGEFDTIVYAVWENNPSFEVVLDGGVDNVDYKERYQTRTIIDLEVPTKTNYKFIRWEKVSGDGVLSGNTYTMGTEDTVIKAIWELNVFKLTIDPNGGTITQEYKNEYAVGETITLETPTRTGYTFNGWTASSGKLSGNVFTMGTNNSVLTANWTPNTYTITFDANGGDMGTTFTTSGQTTYTVSKTGTYKLEVWGAQGGNANSYRGGYGGYSVGMINLIAGTVLYVNVGGQGASGYPNAVRSGGYNGGGSVPSGSGDYLTNRYVAGGGGATHIATASGKLSSLCSNKSAILIVAGGGGGGYQHTSGSPYVGNGGDAGGYVGKNGAGQANYGLGGSQLSAGAANGATSSGVGGFGYGGEAGSGVHGSGGGGGYYGGGGSAAVSAQSNSSGGGGSGYIGNPLLTNKTMYCYSCTESSEESTKTITTTSVSGTATPNYAKSGDGFARISLNNPTQTAIYGSTYGELPTPTRTNYIFSGWNTKADGSGTRITSSSKVNLESNQTLYAIW